MLNGESPAETRAAERCLAFAGVLQALSQVQRTAYGRPVEDGAVRTGLHSLFMLDAASTEAVYGGAERVRDGLAVLVEQLRSTRPRPDMELGRYLITLLVLERKLAARGDLLDALRTGLGRIERQLEDVEVDHPSVVAAVAALYTETISTLTPRVMVKGAPARLADPHVAQRIRALLLAALRSAVLWRQLGGSRLRLLFSRRRLVTDARAWLARIDERTAES